MALSHPTRLRKRLAQSLMFVVMATALAVVPAQISVASTGGGITAYLSPPFVQGPPSSYGVKQAKAAPALGAVCVRGGATARDGVSGRGLTCVQTRTRGLRWRFAPTALTTTTTTTPTATSSTTSTTTTTATSSPTTTSTTTTTVPGVVAPVLVSVSVSDGVQITVAGMRPDTGVYSLQWVPYGQNFNRYQMARATSPSMRVPAEWLACSHTYTFRVFVMQADWQLADGHQTQNVTSQSTPFDVVTTPFDVHMPACTAPATASATASATTPVATCATGGTCIVGNTGPGGGIVFYVSAGNFTSTGSDCNTTCKYLEAAPSDQSTGIVWATAAAFCYADTSDSGTSDCQANSIYSNTAGQAASRTAATAIDKGMANTNQIYARVSNNGGAGGAATNTYAAGIAWAYSNNGKTDWHLPSKDESNQMCKWQRGQSTTAANQAVVCDGTGTLNSGLGASGFSNLSYWSSSESAVNRASYQSFNTGGHGVSDKNIAANRYVRPVRAFG